MAKSNVLTFAKPELRLPKFDLEILFAAQTANLAAVHEAQRVLTDAVQAIAKVQYAYLEQTVTEAKAVLAVKDLPKPEAVLTNAKAGVEKAVATGKEVFDLAVAAQQRVYAVLSERGQSSVDELKAAIA
jgi:hypothetical protein